MSMPNSHLVLHKETLKKHFEKENINKHLLKIINLGAINCPAGRNGLNFPKCKTHPQPSHKYKWGFVETCPHNYVAVRMEGGSDDR